MITAALWCAVALGVLFVAAAIAVPLSALVWWAGWSGRPRPAAPQLPPAEPQPGPFLVYLSGVGDISGDYSTRYEDAFLDALIERVPGLQVITDVFAYSWANVGLTSEGNLGWLWSWLNEIRQHKAGPLRPVGKLIDARNALHIGVSADRRYGPVYNYGVAEMILQALLRHGYLPGSGATVTLMGFSGGGQIALGVAGYVQATLRAPVQVISLGGIFNSSSSLERISALTDFYGSADRNRLIADLIFPARWPLFQGSQWARALASGRARQVCIGPMGHAGKGGLLDDTEHIADGRTYMQVTADAVAAQIRRV